MKFAPISRYALRETLGRQKRLTAASRRAAKHPQDAEAIHGLRVSIRRFTQCLRIFDQLLDPAAPKQLRKRLRKLMDRCAAARNCDVALDLLGQVGLAKSPSVSKLQKARTQAERDLHRWLKTEHRRGFPNLQASRHPPDGDWKLDQSLEDNLRRVLPLLARDFFEAGSAAAVSGASAQALHQFRLRAKRFRYTLELFERFYAREMVRGAQALKGLQDRLGAINDCVTTIDLLGRDRRAVTAIRSLLDRREVEFKHYWKSQFALHGLAWWSTWLGRPARKAPRKILHAAVTAAPRKTARYGPRRPRPNPASPELKSGRR